MTGRDYATAECFALIFVHIGHNIRFTLKTNFQPADDMRRSLATQAMNAVLVATFAWTSMFADISGALLRSSGGVNVDGKPVPSSLALFAGDKISTTSKGVATITAAGSILTLSPGTSVIYGTNSVEMECGHMAVTAMQPGLTAKIRNLQVSPTMAEMETVVHSVMRTFSPGTHSMARREHTTSGVILDCRRGSTALRPYHLAMVLIATRAKGKNFVLEG